MKRPSIAYLDGDILAYRAAFWAEANDPENLSEKIAKDIKYWIPKDISDYIITLSCQRSNNFRRSEWGLYKSNRDSMYSPEYLGETKDILHENYETITRPNIEADDIMGIYASLGKGIAVTIDKDLRGVQGWHFNPDKEINPILISKREAYRFFCKQWMTGDSTDCIPGLWRIGPKKADKLLDKWKKKDWENKIIELYDTDKHRPRVNCGLDPKNLAIAMARCVKILSKEDYNLKSEVIKLWSPKDG